MRNTLPDAIRDKKVTDLDVEETVTAEAEEVAVARDVVVRDLTAEREETLLSKSRQLPQPNEHLT